jgi:hypothetical protein
MPDPDSWPPSWSSKTRKMRALARDVLEMNGYRACGLDVADARGRPDHPGRSTC